MFKKMFFYLRSDSQKGSILRSWIRSIVLTVLLFVVTIVISSFLSMKHFQETKLESQKLLLEQIAVDMDVEIHDAQISLLSFLENAKTQRIARYEDPTSIALTADKMELMRNMKTYSLLNGFIDEIQLFFPRQDYLLTSETLGRSVISHYALFKEYFPDYEQWKDLFLQRQSGDVFIMPTIQHKPSTGNTNVLYYVQTKDFSSEDLDTRAYFSVEGSALTERILNLSLDRSYDRGNIGVFLSDGTIFVSDDFGVWEDLSETVSLPELFLNNDSKISSVSVPSGTLLLLKSRYIGLYYVLFSSGLLNGANLGAWTVVLIIGIVLSVLFALLSVIRFSVANFSTLLEIRNLIFESDTKESDNELKRIRDAIIDSRSQIQSYSSQLDLQKESLIRAQLQTLLLHPGDDPHADETYRSLGFTQPYFGCILFSSYDTEEVLSADTEKNIFLIVQTDRLRAMVQDTGIMLHSMFLQDVFAICVNMTEEQSLLWNEAADEFVRQVQNAWDKVFDTPLAYAYCDPHSGTSAAAHSYNEAIFTLRYKLLRSVDPSPEQDGASYTAYYYPASEENHLLNYLSENSYEDIEKCLNDLWEMNSKAEYGGILLDILACDVSGTFLKYASSVRSSKKQMEDCYRYLAYLQRIPTLDKKKVLLEFAGKLAQEGRKNDSDYNQKLFSEILAYIEDHYTDPNLCVDSICKAFGRSKNFIYSVMKNASGNGILYYINKTRLDHAKELLEDPGMTVEKAAAAVGLSSSLTLTRVFRRYEGITPGQYQNQHNHG